MVVLIKKLALFLGKCSKRNLNFKSWSKALLYGISEPIERLTGQSLAYGLRKRKLKKMSLQNKYKPVKSLKYMDKLFSLLITFRYL